MFLPNKHNSFFRDLHAPRLTTNLRSHLNSYFGCHGSHALLLELPQNLFLKNRKNNLKNTRFLKY